MAQNQATNSATRNLRAAVIGVGYLGRFHAQKYCNLPGVDLVAVADSVLATAQAVGAELNIPVTNHYQELLDKVDLVSVVVPTPLHFAVAADFLRHKVHVLVEKPITETIEQAQQLISLAREHHCILQVGHLERFNPAIQAAARQIRSPRFIESHRLAPFKQRGTDVSVVLDLMIHDIDLIQELVGQPITHIDAVGSPIFSHDIDIANARIRFADGCVANTTASRVSLKQERKLRIFQDDAYISVDLQQKILTVVRKKDSGPIESPAQVSIDEQSFDQGDALKSEVEAFVHAVRSGSTPVVSGEDGLRALTTAMQITDLVNAK